MRTLHLSCALVMALFCAHSLAQQKTSNYTPWTNPNNVPCNPTGSAALQVSCNPLQIANLLSAVIAADVVATSNITLSGPQTIDGKAIGNGQTVFAENQSTSSQDGIYVSAAGAWTRAVNFPAGYVIAQNCDLAVFVEDGSVFRGTTWHLFTTAPITIGTTPQGWINAIALATITNAGAVKSSTTIYAAAVVTAAGAAAFGDCPAWNINTSGGSSDSSLEDSGNAAGVTGPCIVGDANGHPSLQGNSIGPGVTGTGCSLVSGSTDNTGSIAATGVDTCTLTYGSAFTSAPHCAVGNHGATVLANLTGAATTAHAIFATAAAGTFEYVCL